MIRRRGWWALMATELGPGPAQSLVHHSGAQRQATVTDRLLGPLNHRPIQQPSDRAIDPTDAHQLLLQPGGLIDHQGEGGSPLGSLQLGVPEVLKVGHNLGRRQGEGSLKGELGGHGIKTMGKTSATRDQGRRQTRPSSANRLSAAAGPQVRAS